MDMLCARNRGESHSERIICRCIHVTENVVIQAITTLELCTVKEIRQHTGAGAGCTCCHKTLQKYLAPAECRSS